MIAAGDRGAEGLTLNRTRTRTLPLALPLALSLALTLRQVLEGPTEENLFTEDEYSMFCDAKIFDVGPSHCAGHAAPGSVAGATLPPAR